MSDITDMKQELEVFLDEHIVDGKIACTMYFKHSLAKFVHERMMERSEEAVEVINGLMRFEGSGDAEDFISDVEHERYNS